MNDAWELDELLAVLEPSETGPGRFRGTSAPARLRPDEGQRAMVDGSQLLAQALVAARRTADDRFVKSAHMIFARAASAAAPVELHVDPLHAGRSFSSLSVDVRQGERACARGLFLLDTGAPDYVHHAMPMPAVLPPEDATPFAYPVRGREIRIAEGADFRDPDAIGPPRLDAWIRYTAPPDDPALGQALLAHACGPFTIGTSMRPHPGYGEALAHHTLTTGVLSLTVHFHEPSALEGWLLYAHESRHAGRGLCDGDGKIFERGGRLVASFQQAALLREMASGVFGKDVRARF